MPALRLDLLGGFSARLDGGQPLMLPGRKAQALLAYLALPVARRHSREKLTAFLWGDAPELQARQAFRQTLSRLRRALPDNGRGLIVDQQDDLALVAAAVSVDVQEFESALAAGGPADLERAMGLYRGDLLDGLTLDEAPFEEWRTLERERLRELALETLARLLREQVKGQQTAPAIQTAMRLLALDPLQEAVHRTLMRLLLQDGRRAVALQQYQACVATLQRDLGVEPEEETRRLYREILRTTRSPEGRAVSARPAPSPASRVVDTSLIGREGELGQLRAALSRALDDRGHVVLVTGEAGIGKSRLIQEFTTEAAEQPVRLSFGRCHETEQTLPFRPWIGALRGGGTNLGAAVREHLGAATCAHLGGLFPELLPARDAPAAGGAAAPTLLFEPLLEVVGALASEQPLIIIVEDLHWADTMSARLLAFLGRRIHRWPVLIVGSTRPEELGDAPALAQALKELRDDRRLEEVALGPLSEGDSRALVRALQPAARPGEDREAVERQVWEASEGSPFVIVESIRNLQQGMPAAGTRLGRRVQDFVSARLARLAERPRHCVAVAAAIGRDFSFALLARAAGLGEREAADAVEELVRRRILDTVGDRLDFCHDWIRVVAYEDQLPARRALLHAAIGEALETLHHDHLDDVADELGGHYSRAGDVRRAIPHLVRFSHLAAGRYALDDAYRTLTLALAGVDRLPPAERNRERLQLVLRQAFVLSIHGRQREILELLQPHASDVEGIADAALAAEYYFRLGLTQFFLGRRVEAQVAAGRSLARAQQVGDPEAIGKALHVLSLLAYEVGRPGEGIDHARRAIALLDLPHAQAWLGLVYQDLALNQVLAGDLEAAQAATGHMEEIGRQAPLPRLLAFAGYVGAWVHALRGETGRAIEVARAALELSRDPMVTGMISGTLGYAYLEQGEAGTAVALLAEVVERLEASPIRHVQIRFMTTLGEAHLLAGEGERAREVTARALELAQADGTPLNVGLARRALGRARRAAAEPAAAETLLLDALETFTGCGAAFEAARTRVDLAALQATRGDRAGARDQLAAALSVFEAAGAPRRVAAARTLATSLGLGEPAPA